MNANPDSLELGIQKAPANHEESAPERLLNARLCFGPILAGSVSMTLPKLTALALMSLVSIPAFGRLPNISEANAFSARLKKLEVHLKDFLHGGAVTRAAGQELKAGLEKEAYAELLALGKRVRGNPELAHGLRLASSVKGGMGESILILMALDKKSQAHALPRLRAIAKLDASSVATHRQAFPEAAVIPLYGNRTRETFLNDEAVLEMKRKLETERGDLLVLHKIRNPSWVDVELSNVVSDLTAQKGRLPSVAEFVKVAKLNKGMKDNVSSQDPSAMLRGWYGLSVSSPKRRLFQLQRARSREILNLDMEMEFRQFDYIQRRFTSEAGERVSSEPEIHLGSDELTI